MGPAADVTPKIMVLDDEPVVLEVLRMHLERADYQVLTAGSYEELTQVVSDCDVALCDVILPGNDGLQALKWIRQHCPGTPVIMMTGNPTYETAAEAIRTGAYDYLAKPIKTEELLHTIERAVQHRYLTLEKERLEAENEAYRSRLEQRVAEQTQALRESQEFLTTLTNTMADAVFSIKMPGYQIEYVNQAVIEIFGYQPEDLIGQPMHILFPDEAKLATFSNKQDIALAMGQSQIRLEQKMLKKDGELIWAEMVATYVKTDDKLSEMIVVIRDITQRSFLLGVVAHELRSPLGLLNGFSMVMMENLDSIDQESLKKYLSVINNSATRMLKLVDELLDITKIELDEAPLQIEPINISQLIETNSNGYRYVAHKKNITIKERHASEPLVCHCDPIKVGQVISNFIDNAIKYSPPGSVVEITGQRKNSHIWVGVKDEGPGIKPEETQHLFKSFKHNKISSQPTAGEKSSGLGLAICKKIIEAHNGEIGVDSTPGQGSTFWFSLPLEGGGG